jgi:SWIM zinc finger
MASVPHPVPSRMAHNVAVLFGREDDTLLAWQRLCAQVAEALRAQHDPERLSKALALAQGGHVALAEDGYALVTSGTKRYQVQADGVCDGPDYQHRGVPCKHVLAVLIHARAQERVAPSPSPAPPAAASNTPAPTPTKPTRQAKPRHSAAWDVHEAPVSSCFKIRVGAFEWTHTMRATDDAELYTRVQAFVPTFREIVAALDVLQAEREAAKAAPVPQPASTPANMQALIQQAVQQALAAQASANGQAPSTPPPAAPSNGTAAAAGGTPFCHVHQVAMELRTNDRGSWWSHWLASEKRYCKGNA